MPLLTDFIPQASLIPLNGNLGLGTTTPNERLTVAGNISATGIIFGTSTQAVTLTGGAAGQIVYQSGAGITAFTSAGTSGQVLQSNGTGAPTWINQSALAGVSTSTNLVGGAAGRIVYQSGVSTTAFLAAGTSNQVLIYNTNTVAPAWTNQSNLTVGNASLASNLIGNSAGQLLYQSGNNITSLLGYGNSNQVLLSQGSNAVPLWTNQSALSAGYATNLAGGGPGGNIVFQSAAGTTGYTGTGSFGQVLVSRGVESPVWASQSELLTIGQASLASSIAGGGAGQVVYQSADGTTAFVGTGTATHLLQSGGAGAPSWINPSNLAVGTASNLAGGSAGTIPYQSATGTTVQLGAGTAGQVLRSGGAGAPSWINQSSISAGYATNAGYASTAGGAGTATNLGGGSAGTIPYQSVAGTTVQLAAGTAGQVLRSGGAGAPSWINQSSIAAGTATTATHIAAGAQYNLLVQTAASTTGFVTNGSTNGHVLTWSASGPVWQAAATPIGTSTDLQINSLGVGTAASSTTGEIRATNDIIAFFSDERLKEVVGDITNALSKVNTIKGFYYKENDEAKALGYNSNKVRVGVSAQAVQRVLPEVVTRAPIDIAVDEEGNEYSKTGQEYLTVGYDKLVPLLIEAIKELTTKITNLEEEVKSLKN